MIRLAFPLLFSAALFAIGVYGVLDSTAPRVLAAPMLLLGLAAAVRSLAREFGERTGLALDLQLGELPGGLPAEAELNLYRILQEALGNIERHAAARRVEVRLEPDPAAGLLRLRVRDDGRGFVPASARSGMGLVDLRERAEFHGGRCVVRSAPGFAADAAASPEVASATDEFAASPAAASSRCPRPRTPARAPGHAGG